MGLLYKLKNFFIGKVFNIRFIVNGEKKNNIILKNQVRYYTCTTRFTFALAGNGKRDFIAVMTNESAFFGFFL